jgi:hypothetical protein
MEFDRRCPRTFSGWSGERCPPMRRADEARLPAFVNRLRIPGDGEMVNAIPG